jgi:hypothetical protein
LTIFRKGRLICWATSNKVLFSCRILEALLPMTIDAGDGGMVSSLTL